MNRKVISHEIKFREPYHINWNHNLNIMMYSIDGNVRSCVKREEVELDTLPDGIKSIRSLILDRIQILKFCLNASPKSIFKGKKSERVLNSTVHSHLFCRWLHVSFIK
jgi:hypothetical protein